MAGAVRRLGRLVARHHRLHAVRARAAPSDDRTARRQPELGRDRPGGRPDHHDRSVRLGVRRVHFRYYRGLYRPGPYAGAQHLDLQRVHRLTGFCPGCLAARPVPLGTGAEVMIAIPLVAEAFAETQRAKILGFMMTGGGFGTLFGAAIYGWVGNYGVNLDFPRLILVEGAPYAWRTVFFTGIFPALLLAFIRRGMVEPERFAAVKARRQALAVTRDHTEEDRQFLAFVPLQLFSRGIRFQTLVGVLYALGTLLAVWTAAAWLPTIQNLLLEKNGITGGAAIPYVRNGMMLWGIGGIFGYIAFGYVADMIGRRPTIFVYSVGTLIFGFVLFLLVNSYDPYPILLPIYGFFVIGIFSGHAIYMSELFPTQVRSTAVAFCNGSGRVITSFGPLAAGLLVVQLGGLTNATAIMTGFAALSIVAVILGRETRDEQLPR